MTTLIKPKALKTGFQNRQEKKGLIKLAFMTYLGSLENENWNKWIDLSLPIQNTINKNHFQFQTYLMW